MVKTYLRYVQQDVFGLIANSASADVLFMPNSQGRVAIVPNLEDVNIWNVKQGLLVDVLRDPTNSSAVSALALDPQERHLAVGYEDGKIRVWDLKTREVAVSLNAHSAAVTALTYNDTGSLLASGARDTDIVLWDVVAEQGICRLKGHKDEVTDLRFIDVLINIVPDAEFVSATAATATPGAVPPAALATRELPVLVSSSKDTFLKVWDTTLQHCIHTLTGHRAEVWSFDLCARVCDPYALLVAGSTDKTLRTWKLYTTLFAPSSASSEDLSSLFERVGVEYAGSLDRPGGKKRVRRLRFDRPTAAAVAKAKAAALVSARAAAAVSSSAAAAAGDAAAVAYPQNLPLEAHVMYVHGIDKVLDVFTVRGRPERSRRVARRLKRYRDRLKDIEAGRDKSGLEVAPPAAFLPSDDLETQVPVRTDTRVAAIAFPPTGALTRGNTGSGSEAPGVSYAHVLVALQDNLLQTWSMPLVPLTVTHSEDGSGATTGMLSGANAAAAAEAKLQVHYSVALAGHRGGVRVTALASDDSLLLTAAGAQLKLWNMATRNCIRTLDLVEPSAEDRAGATTAAAVDGEEDEGSDMVLCALFVPGNRHVLVGTKRGYLDLYELASGQLLHRERAHEGQPIWSIDLRADQRGFASGGGKEVWGWDFELVEVPIAGAPQGTGAAGGRALKRLTFAQTRALKVSDDVLCVKHSPDGRYLAVGLLDATVRIFHQDTLTFFVSLYGHKLPVLCMDISSDSTMIITGSADKTVKLWGLDFGDLRKSYRAHDSSVMRVHWVPRTHFFFSAGKDRVLKYWDGDRAQEIMSLRAHHAEVWTFALASRGHFLVSAGADKSLRLWQQTEEVVIPEEEREKRLEEELDAGARAGGDAAAAGSARIGQVAGGLVGGQLDSTEVWRGAPATKQAQDLGEQLINALDVCETEAENWRRYHALVRTRVNEWRDGKRLSRSGGVGGGRKGSLASLLGATALEGRDGRSVELVGGDEAERAELAALVAGVPKPAPHPALAGATLSQYVLRTLRSVRLYELTETLLTLPYEYALRLLAFLAKLLEQGNEVELCVKCCLTLLKVHHAQIVSSKAAVEALSALRRHARLRLTAIKDTIGTNMAGLRYLAADIEQAATANYFGEPEEGRARAKRTYDTVAHKRKQDRGIRRLRGMRSK
jgi:U3 small nucleolar RNA-associated protein 12